VLLDIACSSLYIISVPDGAIESEADKSTLNTLSLRERVG
jgi:hypothetical protein